MDSNKKQVQSEPEVKQKWIDFYGCHRPFGEFSNFYSSAIVLDGQRWPTTEHYYQAQKFVHHKVYMEKIRINASPAMAKQLASAKSGKAPPLRAD